MNTTTQVIDNAADEGVVSITEYGDGRAGRVDDFVHSGACLKPVKDRYNAVAAMVDKAKAKATAAKSATLNATSEALAERDAALLVEQRSTDPREGVPADAVARAKRQAAKASRHADEASAEANRAFRERDEAQQLFDACGKTILSYRPRPTGGAGSAVSSVKGEFPAPGGWTTARAMELAPVPKLPAADKLRGFISEQRTERARLRKQRSETAAAPLPAAMAKRQVAAKVSALASAGEIGVVIPSEKGPAGLRWPMKSINAEPPRLNPSAIPQAVDVEAVLAFLFKDRIVELAEAAVDEAYIGVETMLEPHEKAKALRELDASILETERSEAAAIWALIESGDHSVSFRPDTNPRAILGLA